MQLQTFCRGDCFLTACWAASLSSAERWSASPSEQPLSQPCVLTIFPSAQSHLQAGLAQSVGRENSLSNYREANPRRWGSGCQVAANEDTRGMHQVWWCGSLNTSRSIAYSGQAQRWKLSKGNLSKTLDSSKKCDKKLAKCFSALLKDQGERSLCAGSLGTKTEFPGTERVTVQTSTHHLSCELKK